MAMRLTGGQVFDLERGFVALDMCTEGEIISAASTDGVVLNASGCYVIPGLVDLHFHGCMGADFSDGTPDGLQTIAEHQLRRGVTYLCPAAMTLPEESLTQICRTAATHRANVFTGAEVVGIHLEGPFLSPAKNGAQNAAYLHAPDFSMLARLQQAAEGCIKLVTVAPEQPGALDFIRAASRAGIAVSLGHTDSDYDRAKDAFAAGAGQVTHLFNAMPPLHHRHPGLIGAAFDTPHVRAELICDGIHVHESMVRLAFRLFGAERMLLISDSLPAAGLPDGRYPFGGQEIELRGPRAVLAHEPDTLAGSVTDLMGCVRNAVSFGIPLADAIRAAAYNPAQVLGIGHRAGSLDVGKEATFVLLNQDDLSLRGVFFRGDPVEG